MTGPPETINPTTTIAYRQIPRGLSAIDRQSPAMHQFEGIPSSGGPPQARVPQNYQNSAASGTNAPPSADDQPSSSLPERAVFRRSLAPPRYGASALNGQPVFDGQTPLSLPESPMSPQGVAAHRSDASHFDINQMQGGQSSVSFMQSTTRPHINVPQLQSGVYPHQVQGGQPPGFSMQSPMDLGASPPLLNPPRSTSGGFAPSSIFPGHGASSDVGAHVAVYAASQPAVTGPGISFQQSPFAPLQSPPGINMAPLLSGQDSGSFAQNQIFPGHRATSSALPHSSRNSALNPPFAGQSPAPPQSVFSPTYSQPGVNMPYMQFGQTSGSFAQKPMLPPHGAARATGALPSFNAASQPVVAGRGTARQPARPGPKPRTATGKGKEKKEPPTAFEKRNAPLQNLFIKDRKSPATPGCRQWLTSHRCPNSCMPMATSCQPSRTRNRYMF
jgi:hypothetical protein